MKTLKEYINEASILDIKGTMTEGDEMQKIYELAEAEFKKLKKKALDFKKYKDTKEGMYYRDRSIKKYDLSFGTPSYTVKLDVSNICTLIGLNKYPYPYNLINIHIVPNAGVFEWDDKTNSGEYRYWDWGTMMLLTNAKSREARSMRRIYLTSENDSMQLSDAERHTFTKTPEEQISKVIELLFKDLDTFASFIKEKYDKTINKN